MSSRTLPTILSVEYIPAEELILSPKMHIAPGDAVTAVGIFQPLKMVEPASSETTPERTENGLVYTTIVQGTMFDDNDRTMEHRLQTKFHCYRISDVYRNRYLVGVDEGPYPEITFIPSTGRTPSDRRAVSFEIKWISTLPPVDIIEL